MTRPNMTWCIQMRFDSCLIDMPHAYVTSDLTHVYVTWLMHFWLDSWICDMTREYQTWLMHTWHLTWLTHLWHDVCAGVAALGGRSRRWDGRRRPSPYLLTCRCVEYEKTYTSPCSRTTLEFCDTLEHVRPFNILEIHQTFWHPRNTSDLLTPRNTKDFLTS